MTAKKGIFLGLGVIIIIVVLALGLALSSGVQTWFILKMANGQPGLRLQADELHVGFGGFTGRRIHVDKDGMTVDVPAIDADFSTLSVATSKKLVLARFVAHGIKVDTQNYRPASAGSASTASNSSVNKPSLPASKPATAPTPHPGSSGQNAFTGVMNQVQFPLELTVNNVEVDGTAMLAQAAPKAALPVTFTLKGSGLAPTQEGTFTLTVTAIDATPKADVSSIALNATLKATESDHRTIDALNASFDLATAGRLITGPSEKLHGVVDLKKNAGNSGEDYLASIAVGNAAPLVDLRSHFDSSSSHLTGRWSLATTQAQLAPYLMGAPTPNFEASGEGAFTVDGRTGTDASAQGDLRVKLSQLDAVSPTLASLGPLETATHFEAGVVGNSAKLTRLKVTVVGAKPILAIESLQAASLDLATNAISYEKGSGDFLRVLFAGVPLAWAKPFLPGMDLSGDDLRGELVVAPQGNDVAHFKTATPIQISRLGLAHNGQPALANLDVSLALEGEFSAKKLHLTTAQLGIKNGATSVVDLKTSADLALAENSPSGSAKINLAVNLAALAAQPSYGGKPALSAGKLVADLDASLGAAKTINGQITIDQLATANRGPALPSLSAKLKVNQSADQKLSVEAPITLTGTNRKTDITLTASTTPRNGGQTFVAELKSESVFVDDFQTLAAALLPGPANDSPTTTTLAPAPTVRATPTTSAVTAKPLPKAIVVKDSAPFWQGTSGEAKFSFTQIAVGAYRISGFSGKLALDSDKIEIPSIAGTISESPFKFSAKVSFDAKQAAPYALASTLSLSKFDEGKLVKALQPGLVPALDGVFDLNANFGGQGLNQNDLAQRVHGEANVTSQNGTYHVISSSTIGGLATESNLNIASGLLSQFTQGTGNSLIQVVGQVAASLFSYRYDHMSLKLTRDPSLDILISDLRMQASSLNIEGSGKVTYAEEKSFLDLPLALAIQLYAANDLAKGFNALKMLGSPPKDNFYPVTPIFNIKGTVGKPDSSEITNALKKAATGQVIQGLLNGAGR